MKQLFFVSFLIVSIISFNIQKHVMKDYKRMLKKYFISNMFNDNDNTIQNINPGLLFTTKELSKKLNKNILSLGMPKVIPPYNSKEDWLLWFHFRDDNISSEVVQLSTGRVLFATSKDGINDWEFHSDNPVMSPSKENGDWFYFDSEHVGIGDIIQPGSTTIKKFANQENVFLMYLFGGNGESKISLSENVQKKIIGSKIEIGVAVSQDGIHWSRIEGPSAYGSIIEVGKKTEDFDSLFVGWPSVIEIGSEYHMYYHTFDKKSNKFVVGLAIAPDGLLKWNKVGPVFKGNNNDDNDPTSLAFDAKGVTRRHVIRQPNGMLKMYYEGVSNKQEHAIGIAFSKDGLEWNRYSDQPIFMKNNSSSSKKEENTFDNGGVGSPHLVWLPEKKRWRMYYVGYPKNNNDNNIEDNNNVVELLSNGIGIAESIDEDGMIFERIVL